METLVSGIALAILSGLTFLAYKHPDAYEKLHVPLVIALAIVTVGSGIWHIAISQTFNTIVGHIQVDKLDDALEMLDTIRPPIWGVFVSLGIYLYLTFLSALPNLLGKQEPPDPQDGEKHD